MQQRKRIGRSFLVVHYARSNRNVHRFSLLKDELLVRLSENFKPHRDSFIVVRVGYFAGSKPRWPSCANQEPVLQSSQAICDTTNQRTITSSGPGLSPGSTQAKLSFCLPAFSQNCRDQPSWVRRTLSDQCRQQFLH